MSENLIESVSPYLSPPVTRGRGGAAADSGEGADLAIPLAFPLPAAGDDDE